MTDEIEKIKKTPRLDEAEKNLSVLEVELADLKTEFDLLKKDVTVLFKTIAFHEKKSGRKIMPTGVYCGVSF